MAHALAMNPNKTEPLANHPRYEKVSPAHLLALCWAGCLRKGPPCLRMALGPTVNNDRAPPAGARPQQRNLWVRRAGAGQEHGAAVRYQVHRCAGRLLSRRGTHVEQTPEERPFMCMPKGCKRNSVFADKLALPVVCMYAERGDKVRRS